MRADERDVQAIKDVAGHIRITQKILFDRFIKEMTHVVGRRRDIESNFLAVIERVFGTEAANEMERQVRRRS
jgi:hypothetical protein